MPSPRRISTFTSRWSSAHSAACSSRRRCLRPAIRRSAAPGDAGQISLSVRNAINFGLFDGPRVTAAGRYLTTRQGLTDWYPTWIGAPDTSIGRLVTSKDEAIEEIRVQVKNGVDCIKIAMDGTQTRENGELIAAFNQDETSSMVTEAHRLGKRVVVHARGREAILYSARAGVDLIFHAYLPRRRMHRGDGEIRLAPSARRMTFPRNIIDFTQPHEPAAIKGRISDTQREYEIACVEFAEGEAGRCADDDRNRFRLRGHAVRRVARDRAGDLRAGPWLFTRRRRCCCATSVTSRFMANGGKFGVLEPGRFADFIAIDGSPIENIAILQDKQRIRHVHIAGKRMQIPARWLRSAPGHRSKLEQLDRSLYAGAGQVAAAEPGIGLRQQPSRYRQPIAP